jgi:hypothetical protein
MTFECPACQHPTDVELPKSGVVWGSGPPLTIRYDCAGCGLTLNATTSTPVVI